MKKSKIEEVINIGLKQGAEFVDLFFEDKINFSMNLISNKINNCSTDFINGVGIRVYTDSTVLYSYTNNITFKSIKENISKLLINSNNNNNKIKLERIVKKPENKKIIHLKDYSKEKIKQILINMNNKIRQMDSRIYQVEIKLKHSLQNVLIANSYGKYRKDQRVRTIMYLKIFVREGNNIGTGSNRFGHLGGFEVFEKFDTDSFINNAYNMAINNLNAINIEGGKMPVVIGNGFGAVIFHEACAHSLEATTVANGISSFANMIGSKVVSDKVTLIDNGAINDVYGSTFMDDEGEATRKNVLIEKGVLKSYLIDTINGFKMNQKSNGCARRESYYYAPTSRMNNTYLEVGNDKIEDMIRSIKYGLYATDFSGGAVNPVTGDYNFTVTSAYLIENGEITKPVKDVSLIGNGLETIKKIEMVSDDLEFSPGVCGSVSGKIPVTIGQPTIKVQEILVGGGRE